MSFQIKDRVAVGDNKYMMQTLDDGRVLLTPAPDSVQEPGTPFNKEVFQPIFNSAVVKIKLSYNQYGDANGRVSALDGTPMSEVFKTIKSEENVSVEIHYVDGVSFFFVFEKKENYVRLFSLSELYGYGNPMVGFLPYTESTKILTIMSDGTNELTEVGSMDRVVDIGTSDSWKYFKWDSGVAECWGNLLFKYTTVMTDGGNYAITNDKTEPVITYPTGLFKQIDCISVTPMGAGYPIVSLDAGSDSTSSVRCSIRTEWAVTDTNIWLHCRITGKWK